MNEPIADLIYEAAEAWEKWMIAILKAGTQQHDNKEARQLARQDFIDAAIMLSEMAEEDAMTGPGGKNA